MMVVERVLGSPLRIRILLALWSMGEACASELARSLKTNYGRLLQSLQVLVQYGLVEERRVGRVRLVRLGGGEIVESLVRALIAADAVLEPGACRR